MDLKSYIQDIPDWPKEGVIFRDITPLLGNAQAFQKAVEAMAEPVSTLEVSHIMGIEARGFIFGAALAQIMQVGFVPARKPGKLPRKTLRESYGLEYGEDAIEIHTDAFKPGDRVLIVDDVLATGGTALAARRLVEATGATALALAVFIELTFLPGREKLQGFPVFSIQRY